MSSTGRRTVSERTPEALAARVDALLKRAADHPRRHTFGGVNWGDLRCVEVAAHRPLWPAADIETWVVVIEEAMPNATLGMWVAGELLMEGWENVEVQCDW